MQKELQNGQKQKCKIYKLTKCSSSEDPTKGQSDLISHLSREICFRCQINYTTERRRNQKSCEKIHFHRHHELQEYLFAWAATAQLGGIFPDVLPKSWRAQSHRSSWHRVCRLCFLQVQTLQENNS